MKEDFMKHLSFSFFRLRLLTTSKTAMELRFSVIISPSRLACKMFTNFPAGVKLS